MEEGLPKVTDSEMDVHTPPQGVIDLTGEQYEEEGEDLVEDDEPLDDDAENAYGEEEDEEDQQYAMRRTVSFNAKRSRAEFEQWQRPVGKPDLAEYFDQFKMDDQSVIAVCRSYASYLAAKNRPAGGKRGPYKKRVVE